jgi:hypothetical protein
VREESAAASEAELASKFTEASVVRFAVSPEGASAL